MALYDTPNLTTGIDQAIVDIAGTVPIFTPLFLVFVYFTILFSGMNAERKRRGSSDMAMWSTVASLSIFIISLALTLTAGLIDLLTLSVVASITIISGVWLFFSRNRNEA